MATRGDTMVIGLGRFGLAVAETLVALGHEVLGVDRDHLVVQGCASTLTQVVQADGTDAETLRQLGAADFASALVAVGTDVESSILATYALVDLGVPRIWAKAITDPHGAILERIGAARVIYPERDMGIRAGHAMTGRTLDYLELDDGFALAETTAPRELIGRSLAEAQVRGRFGVSVVCVKPAGGAFTYATPDTVLREGDLVVVAGETAAADAFAALP